MRLFLRALAASAFLIGVSAAFAASQRSPQASAGSSSKPRVLITYFEPYNAKTNTSEGVAFRIRELLRPDIDVDLCLLPVVYRRSGGEARKCYEAAFPRAKYALSIGQTGCEIALETRYGNLDSDPESDNEGDLRKSQVIDHRAPPRTGANYAFDEALCAANFTGAEKSATKLSISAGNYVCNHTAFEFSRYLARKFPSVRYALAHVPSAGCDAKAPTADLTASALAKFLRAQISLDREAHAARIRNPFPFTAEAVSSRIDSLAENPQRACRIEYLKNLSNQFFEEQLILEVLKAGIEPMKILVPPLIRPQSPIPHN